MSLINMDFMNGSSGREHYIGSLISSVTSANARDNSILQLDVTNFNTLKIGQVSKSSGITVTYCDIRNQADNAVIYQVNISDSEQIFDVSDYTSVKLTIDITGTTAWTYLRMNDISLY